MMLYTTLVLLIILINTNRSCCYYSSLSPLSISSNFLKLLPKISHTVSLSAKSNKWEPPKEEIADNDNGVAYSIELPKRAGISWGSDLSFSWIYVLDLEPSGEAAGTGIIEKGDYIIGIGNTSTIAKDFDFVLSTLSSQKESKFNYTFFRGSKEQLMGGPVLEPSDMTVSVTVLQEGKSPVIFNCPGGTNLRQLLLGKGINVYRSLTRWTNCNGKQRCGTCIVDIKEGLENCNRKALDEELVLRENPETYRLSCVTTVYGDVTVEVQSPVGADQWTR